MRKIILLGMLLVSSLSFCQADKDTKLNEDKEVVKATLELMHYLDQCAMQYYKLPAQEAAESTTNFADYFNRTILAHNPSPSISIPEFLGYNKGYVPPSWEYFIKPVYEANMKSLLEITENYGYPSSARVKVLHDGKQLMPLIFIVRTEGFDKESKKIFRLEYKAGNISDNEYHQIKVIQQNRKNLTGHDLKKADAKMIKS